MRKPELARRAVERVLERQSELRELWEETGSDSAWHTDVRALLEKLGGEAAFVKTATPAEEAAPLSFTHEKQAIFTFLGARGLTPTPQEAARIEASLDKQEVHRWLARAMSVASVAELLDG